jgi:hypothetical protein
VIQPDELRTERPYGPRGSRGCDVWDAICAAVSGDAAALWELLKRDPNLARYHQPIHFAACGGHLEAVRMLLDADADPDAEFNGVDPVTAAPTRTGRMGPTPPGASRCMRRRAPATARSWNGCSRPRLPGSGELSASNLDERFLDRLLLALQYLIDQPAARRASKSSGSLAAPEGPTELIRIGIELVNAGISPCPAALCRGLIVVFWGFGDVERKNAARDFGALRNDEMTIPHDDHARGLKGCGRLLGAVDFNEG